MLALRRFYARFNAWVSPQSPFSLETWMDRIQTRLPPSPRTVLDLGGGSGANRMFFCGPADDYVILEVDPEVQFVRENAGKHDYVIGDAHSDVFAPSQFDLILMIEVLEHLRDPFKIFENCSRWLKPGGMLFVKVPQYWHIHGWPSDYFRYTVYGLKELCRRSNLEVVDIWPLGGPGVLLLAVFMLNFGRVFEWPILRQLISNPLLLVAKAVDRLFFPDYTRMKNPDTRGWIMMARKGDGRPRPGDRSMESALRER